MMDAPRSGIFDDIDIRLTAEHRITVSFLEDRHGFTIREETLSLDELVTRIHAAQAPSKERLPWIKLGRFGTRRSKKNSLRHNDNVLAITGIEADYDRKEMSLADAKDRITANGLCALIYPSPSYTPAAPKWRILCPTSKEYPPEMRARFMARLNGLFGDIFAHESFTLSQGFYYGKVNNPDHHCTLFPGIPIDLADDLDAGAIGRAKERNIGERPHPASRPEDITDKRINGLISALLDNVRKAADGEKHFVLRDNGLTLGGYLHLTGWSKEEAVEQLLRALPSADDWDKARETALWAVEHGMAQPLDLEDRPNPHAGNRRPPPPEPPPASEAEHNPNGPDKPSKERGPKSDDSFVLPVEFSENALAYRFSDHHAETLLYVPKTGRWLRYEAGLWREDHAVSVFDAARKICAEQGDVALAALGKKTGPKVAAMINRASCVAAIERLARHHHRHVREGDTFDADPLLLNGATITGKLSSEGGQT
jgi:hypothetical protein